MMLRTRIIQPYLSQQQSEVTLPHGLQEFICSSLRWHPGYLNTLALFNNQTINWRHCWQDLQLATIRDWPVSPRCKKTLPIHCLASLASYLSMICGKMPSPLRIAGFNCITSYSQSLKQTVVWQRPGNISQIWRQDRLTPRSADHHGRQVDSVLGDKAYSVNIHNCSFVRGIVISSSCLTL